MSRFHESGTERLYPWIQKIFSSFLIRIDHFLKSVGILKRNIVKQDAGIYFKHRQMWVKGDLPGVQAY
jgi:hypothetical protein